MLDGVMDGSGAISHQAGALEQPCKAPLLPPRNGKLPFVP